MRQNRDLEGKKKQLAENIDNRKGRNLRDKKENS